MTLEVKVSPALLLVFLYLVLFFIESMVIKKIVVSILVATFVTRLVSNEINKRETMGDDIDEKEE